MKPTTTTLTPKKSTLPRSSHEAPALGASDTSALRAFGLPSFTPRALAALRQRGVDVQHERVGIDAHLSDDERDLAGLDFGVAAHDLEPMKGCLFRRCLATQPQGAVAGWSGFKRKCGSRLPRLARPRLASLKVRLTWQSERLPPGAA